MIKTLQLNRVDSTLNSTFYQKYANVWFSSSTSASSSLPTLTTRLELIVKRVIIFPSCKHPLDLFTATCFSSICSSCSRASMFSSFPPESLHSMPPSSKFQLYLLSALAFFSPSSSSDSYV